jgi:hypothetical protein
MVREAERRTAAIAAGKPLRPLAVTSINKTLTRLAQILESRSSMGSSTATRRRASAGASRRPRPGPFTSTAPSSSRRCSTPPAGAARDPCRPQGECAGCPARRARVPDRARHAAHEGQRATAGHRAGRRTRGGAARRTRAAPAARSRDGAQVAPHVRVDPRGPQPPDAGRHGPARAHPPEVHAARLRPRDAPRRRRAPVCGRSSKGSTSSRGIASGTPSAEPLAPAMLSGLWSNIRKDRPSAPPTADPEEELREATPSRLAVPGDGYRTSRTPPYDRACVRRGSP